MPLKFKKASADEVHAKRKQHAKDVASGTALVKGFKAPPSWNKDSRSARFIMSSEMVDRYRDIVVQAGMDTTAFERNPQGLLFHNSRAWPIGLWSDITKILNGRPRRTEGVLNFLPEGTDEDADRAARHVEAGSMRTVSIGFIPNYEDVDFILDEDEDWTGGFRFNSCELIECSLVPVPANPDALVKDAGGDFTLARDLIEDILDTYTKTPEGLLVPLDAYQLKHFEIGGNRTSVVVDKALLPVAKDLVPRDDLKLKATTDAEAREFVGAKVTVDPAHPENKEWPMADVLAKAVGEVIDSYIVDHGEKKGVHGLAVEFLTDAYSGMFRGIKAERFLLVKSEDEPSEDSEDEVDEAAEAIDVDESKSTKSVEKTSVTVDVQVETNVADTQKHFEDLEATVDRVEKRVDGVFAKIVKFFGGSPTKEEIRSVLADVRVEPELEIAPEVKEPPTEEERAVARRAAAEALAKLRAKGMIAAE